MALYQQLKIWASKLSPSGSTENVQRRLLRDEEFLDGWLYMQSLSAQQLNQLFNLLTIHSNPSSNAPVLYPTSAVIPTEALEMNGQIISEEDYPNAYSLYGDTLPDLTAEAPSGFTYIIRKS